MTANELIALLGLAWSRLLLYPGGLAAFAAVWLLAAFQADLPGSHLPAASPAVVGAEVETAQNAGRPASQPWFLILGALVPPWLGLALLPLPPAPGLSRQVDIVVALALLECPRVLAIGADLRGGGPRRRAGARRLAAALNGYPPLLLATLVLAQAAGTLDVAALARVPGELAPPFAIRLHWIGVAGWLLALPSLLGIGPFRAAWLPTSPAPQKRESLRANLRARMAGAARVLAGDPLRAGLGLRALGLLLLSALPWMAALGALEEGGLRAARGAAGWLLAPPLIAALAWGYDRLTASRPARDWARLYLALDAALLLALLWAAYQALLGRLA